MNVDVREESSASLSAYASIPIAFNVIEVWDVEVQHGGLAGLGLQLRSVDPYVKDYDSIDGGPLSWAQRFDLTNWGLLAAYADGQRVGGAAVAFGTPGLSMLEDRADLAVETQNVNVPACRFYLRNGFVLGAIHRFAYPSLPEEIQRLWYKALGRQEGDT